MLSNLTSFFIDKQNRYSILNIGEVIFLNYIGIDIGSTATKVVVRGDNNIEFCLPTGWNSKETLNLVKDKLIKNYNINPEHQNNLVISTGYGRISVDYADKEITEITCHAKGATELTKSNDFTVIDVGGQDTKVINVSGGFVEDFIMNDKCSAGTGKFIEIMANRLSITLDELFIMADQGEILEISSMCTVFAESEIIGHIGNGEPRENIAAGVVDSVVSRVGQLANRQGLRGDVILTGGFSISQIFNKKLSNKLDLKIISSQKGRYAGAVGAALIAKEKFEEKGYL